MRRSRIANAQVGAASYALEAGESVQFDIIDMARIYLYGKEHDKVSYLGLQP